MAVKGLTNAPQYYIGDQPKFTMVVTNIGLVACKRDVGAAVLAAYVYSLETSGCGPTWTARHPMRPWSRHLPPVSR
ncbi:putative cONSERVED MEMBRANE PROTEIN [Mycobacterium ulcerans str. Harvey]|uniref:CONSERVED MEMBRANE PROTEIN n=1 Tax=Mycobacterium ulcerans str. Harvey TaxID=1299332 RepID=A0ABN0RA30_MYCUL|nr:putative cONSERVED MEMBRANE PROTEIN [Mycobacterium ulcerans str. Harvey]